MLTIIVAHMSLFLVCVALMYVFLGWMTRGATRRTQRIVVALTPAFITTTYAIFSMLMILALQLLVRFMTSREYDRFVFGLGSTVPAARVGIIMWLCLHLMVASAIAFVVLIALPPGELYNNSLGGVSAAFAVFSLVPFGATFLL